LLSTRCHAAAAAATAIASDDDDEADDDNDDDSDYSMRACTQAERIRHRCCGCVRFARLPKNYWLSVHF